MIAHPLQMIAHPVDIERGLILITGKLGSKKSIPAHSMDDSMNSHFIERVPRYIQGGHPALRPYSILGSFFPIK